MAASEIEDHEYQHEKYCDEDEFLRRRRGCRALINGHYPFVSVAPIARSVRTPAALHLLSLVAVAIERD